MSNTRRRIRLGVERLEDRLTPSDNPALVPPVLNSRLGAPATLYLDFNGHTDASWSTFSNVDTPPFDTDGSVNSWSTMERQQITDIWTFVAEDYAPFNVNVSTVLPASFAARTAIRAAIGGNGSWFNSSGGILGVAAALNSFSVGVNGVTETVYVFAVNHTTNVLQNISFTVSHEAGHAFGLEHQSEYNASGGLVNTYYGGLPDGTSPIMGGNDVPTRNLWWYGTSAVSATTFQDDMSVIAGAANGFGFRVDDHGGNAASSTLLVGVGSGAVNVNSKGVIAQMTDVDVFRVKALPGPMTFTANVVEPFNNLDLKVELRDSAGNVLASSNPTGSFDASVSFDVTKAGTYYLFVSSSGVSSAATSNNFGQNVGQFDVTGSFIVDSASQGPGGSPLSLLGPVRWVYNRKARAYRAQITLLASVDITGPFSVTLKLPHPSVRWVSPIGTRVGKTVKLDFSEDLVANQPVRFIALVQNPRSKNLGTFFRGLRAFG